MRATARRSSSGPDLRSRARSRWRARRRPRGSSCAAGRPGIVPAARGAFQRRNFALARAAAEALLGELDDDGGARRGRLDARAGPLRGRRRRIRRRCSTARTTPAGMRALAESLPEWLDGPRARRRRLDPRRQGRGGDAAALIPHTAHIVFTTQREPARAVARDAAVAGAPARLRGGQRRARPARRAGRGARIAAGPAGAVLATGSIYLIADLLRPAGARGATL